LAHDLIRKPVAIFRDHAQNLELKMLIRVLAVLGALLLAAPALAQPVKLPAGADPQNTLVVDTTQGRIIIKLRNDIAPNHVARLKQLAREGFYNNVPFHRVLEGFMAQTGDGQRGDGTGGSKYPNLKAEFSNVSFQRGVVGMARASSNDSANSQWFICYGDASFLDGKYTVIGQVLSGMDVADKLKRGEPVQNPDKMVRVQVAADAK
jgi:peptidylprolyl isomerase